LAVSYAYAEKGWWDKAVVGFGKCFAREVSASPAICFEYALLLVQVGDTSGYRKLCGRMLERFGPNRSEDQNAYLARVLVLAPQALPEIGPILEAAQRRKVRIGPDSGHYVRNDHVLALAYYRAGQYAKARETVSAFLTDPARADFDVANWLLLAMTEERLAQHAKAVSWLDKADRWLAQHGNPAEFRTHEWGSRLILQLLHREAETLIRGKTVDQPPRAKTNPSPQSPSK
jgi:hypothetical protein